MQLEQPKQTDASAVQSGDIVTGSPEAKVSMKSSRAKVVGLTLATAVGAIQGALLVYFIAGLFLSARAGGGEWLNSAKSARLDDWYYSVMTILAGALTVAGLLFVGCMFRVYYKKYWPAKV